MEGYPVFATGALNATGCAPDICGPAAMLLGIAVLGMFAFGIAALGIEPPDIAVRPGAVLYTPVVYPLFAAAIPAPGTPYALGPPGTALGVLRVAGLIGVVDEASEAAGPLCEFVPLEAVKPAEPALVDGAVGNACVGFVPVNVLAEGLRPQENIFEPGIFQPEVHPA